MGFVDFSKIVEWAVIVGVVFLLMTLLSKVKRGSKEGVIQSKSIVLNEEPAKVFDACITMVDQDNKLILHSQDRENGELKIDRKPGFSRAPARIAINIKHISRSQAEVWIESRPKYNANGAVIVDFGQNLENVEYVSRKITDKINQSAKT